MLPLLRSSELEPANLDRKVILLTPGKREEGHTLLAYLRVVKGMLAGVEQDLFPSQSQNHKIILSASMIGNSENMYLRWKSVKAFYMYTHTRACTHILQGKNTNKKQLSPHKLSL